MDHNPQPQGAVIKETAQECLNRIAKAQPTAKLQRRLAEEEKQKHTLQLYGHYLHVNGIDIEKEIAAIPPYQEPNESNPLLQECAKAREISRIRKAEAAVNKRHRDGFSKALQCGFGQQAPAFPPGHPPQASTQLAQGLQGVRYQTGAPQGQVKHQPQLQPLQGQFEQQLQFPGANFALYPQVEHQPQLQPFQGQFERQLEIPVTNFASYPQVEHEPQLQPFQGQFEQQLQIPGANFALYPQVEHQPQLQLEPFQGQFEQQVQIPVANFASYPQFEHQPQLQPFQGQFEQPISVIDPSLAVPASHGQNILGLPSPP